METFVASILAYLARRQIRRLKLGIIGVTGSVGKTSTKQAIALALSSKYRIRAGYKNYNNAIGLPLAILGEQSPGRDVSGWCKLFWRAYRCQDSVDFLVLEYGVDQPGDMAELLRIAVPDIAVITAISPVHVSNYPNLTSLINEKAQLGESVSAAGLVLLNGDDSQVVELKPRFKATVQTYSLSHGDAYMTDYRLEYPPDVPSMSSAGDKIFAVMYATLHVGDASVELKLKNSLSPTMMTAALAALVVADHLGVSLHAAAQALEKEFMPVNGRLKPLAGIKGSFILDDSYNAAPASMRAGLEALKTFLSGEDSHRRVAVLGDMAELGDLSELEHRALATQVASVADVFVAVGSQMKLAVESAETAGLHQTQIHWFANSIEAGRYLDRNIESGDIILVKGSQSQRMEKAVKEIMAEPNKASELLVRQEVKWLI